MIIREEIQNIVWNKIREINNGSPSLSQSHSSDNQYIELVEYFLPKIDETVEGQEYADMLFISRSFDSIKDDVILHDIKSILGILEIPNEKEYVQNQKEKISQNILNYKNRKSI